MFGILVYFQFRAITHVHHSEQLLSIVFVFLQEYQRVNVSEPEHTARLLKVRSEDRAMEFGEIL
jgi:hypothetical protein